MGFENPVGKRFDVSEGDAIETLSEAARQANVEIFYSADAVLGVRTVPISGNYDPLEAFRRMFSGTALEVFQHEESGVFLVKKSKLPNDNPENSNEMDNTLKRKSKNLLSKLLFAIIPITSGVVSAQEDALQDEEVYELSPFEISTSSDVGYLATSTLAGTRLKTDLRDVGSAISVITKEFLEDTGAVDNETLLMYTTNTEVGGVYSSYSGASLGQVADESAFFDKPNSNTRVRGLAAADNTRDFFLTDIAWDGYNIERVDLQRGPNSILFGLGSPAGIINTSTQSANMEDSGSLGLRYGSYNSTRFTLNLNRVILKDELAVRIAGLKDHEYFRQNPAYEDDERGFVAVRWEPKFLEKRGINLSLKGNMEGGTINSNRPRNLTPTDFITAWFRDPSDPLGGLGKKTFNPYTAQTVLEGHPDWGAAIPATLTGQPNPAYLPLLGAYGQEFGGPIAIHSSSSGAPDIFMVAEPDGRTGTGGIDEFGNYDGVVYAYNRMVGVGNFYDYATRVGLPFSEYGQYKNFALTDSSIFDYYNQLIDGSNKREWNNFHSYNVAGSLNILDNKFGVEVVYDYQDFESGRMGGVNNTLYIDPNENLGDYSLNPNIGRPYVSTNYQYGNNISLSVREAKRATAYADIDFSDITERSDWWVRLLGRHVFTALLSDDSNSKESRSFMRYASSNEYGEYIGSEDMTGSLRVINSFAYLGDSLLNSSSAIGANIPNPVGTFSVPSGNYRVFDSTWIATDVNPADPYTYPHGYETVQGKNPDNYAGWFDFPMTVLSADDPSSRDLLTTNATKNFERVRSAALVWQGYLWDRSIVTTAGWRRDRAKAWLTKADKDVHRSAIIDSSYQYTEEAQNDVESESRSYSVAWHITDFVKEWFNSPINVSLYYNRSSNFQPAAGRVDLMANPIAAPNGKTIDQSILLSTKDNRYSFKITKYENSVNLATGSAYGQASMLGAMEAWAGIYTNVFEYDLGGFTFDSANIGEESRYNYVPAVGESAEDAVARENAAVSAWRAHQNRIRTEFPGFYDLWLDRDPTEEGWINSSAPAGFTLTEDTISKGYEFEFIANPTNNWRISVNASKVEAIRSNVGGEFMNKFMDLMLDDLNNTPAGDIRIWWGSAGSPTAQTMFTRSAGAEWELVKLKEGTSADEIREWRFNLITNYSFSEGALTGLNVGGSYRWEDDIVIGYPLMEGADGRTTYNLNEPYKGPANGYFDFWVGYRKMLKSGIEWKIQANVRNAFSDDTLIPLTTQPDGTPAALRIPPNTVWTVSNTFSF